MTESRTTRIAHVVAALMLCGAVVSFVWPVHAWASRVEPIIFGLPFSIVWIVFWQLMVFAALLLLFRLET